MRLWHQVLIPHLPRQQLLGLHCECCALRGVGWGRKHATVDYVFTHEPAFLYAYHHLIIDEMKNRGYSPNYLWNMPEYRGKTLEYDYNFIDFKKAYSIYCNIKKTDAVIYPEHNDAYLQECIDNLRQKGIEIDVSNKTKER